MLKGEAMMPDAKYTAVIELPPGTLAHYRYLLGRTGRQLYDEFGLKRDETITHTAKFSNGFEADIKIVNCEEDPPYIDAVLFDPKGSEVCCHSSGEEYSGEYCFRDHNDNEYFVQIQKKEKQL